MSRFANMQATLKPAWTRAWNGPFYVGPLVQPISVGSAILKVLEVAWRSLIVLFIIVLSTLLFNTAITMIDKVTAPKDQEECKAKLAKYGAGYTNRFGSTVECERSFPGVRLSDGTYSYYDAYLGDWISVSGPTLSQSDLNRLVKLRSAKQVELAQIESAKNTEEVSRFIAMSQISVTNYDISCNVDSRYIACYDKNITVRLINRSSRKMTGLHFSYEIGKGLNCSGSLSKKFFLPMTLNAHEPGSFVQNVLFKDAGPEGVMTGCVKLDEVDQIE